MGEVPEWPKGADCKSAGDAFEGSNPSLSTNFAGIAQLVERKPSKLGVAGSSPVSRSTLVIAVDGTFVRPVLAPIVGTARPTAIDRHAQVAQSVEHVLGKDEVSGSIPLLGFAFRFGQFWGV